MIIHDSRTGLSDKVARACSSTPIAPLALIAYVIMVVGIISPQAWTLNFDAIDTGFVKTILIFIVLDLDGGDVGARVAFEKMLIQLTWWNLQ